MQHSMIGYRSIFNCLNGGKCASPVENKKLSCCCDSRSYCMQQYVQQYDRLIKTTAWFLFLTLFIAIAASRSVNENVSIQALL